MPEPTSDDIKALAKAGQKIERQLNDLREDLQEYAQKLAALKGEKTPPNPDPEPSKKKGFFDDFFGS